MEECKVVELFAGVGGFRVGLENADKDFFKTIWANQWEPETKVQHAAIIYEKNFGKGSVCNKDINTIPVDEIPDCEMLVMGFPCLAGNTMVLTSDGYKPIINVTEGDMVLSHDNKYHRVTKFMNQGIKPTFKIKGSGFDCIEATGNHRFLVREKIRKTIDKRYTKCFLPPEWKSVNELKFSYKKYYLGSSINQNSIIPKWGGIEINVSNSKKCVKNNLDMTDKCLWYIIGRFLGDGWLRKNLKKGELRYKYNGIIICCGKHKLKELRSKISDKYKYTISEDRTTYKLIFNNCELAAFCEQFYSSNECKCYNKRIPGFVLDLPVKYIEELLNGYHDSDGCTNGIYNQFTSVSLELLYGVAHCIEKAWHKPSMIYKNNVPNSTLIEGRIVNQKTFYTLRYRRIKPKRSSYFFEDGYVWYPIRDIEEYIEQPVYDIEVEETHSFIANHCITHNCQDYSVCSTLSHSKGIEGKKGVLWWSIYKILKEKGDKRPKILFLENVDRLLLSPAKQRGRDFAIILECLNEFGYIVEWRVINAADYGMPQKRRRTYIVAYQKDSGLVKGTMASLVKVITNDGIFAQAFPIKELIDCFTKITLSNKADDRLVDITNNFNKDNKVKPFLKAGLMIDGIAYSADYEPLYDGEYMTLGDCMAKGNDRPEDAESFYIPESDIERWKWFKGTKREERTKPDGFKYFYTEGAMPFPDPLDRPSRTIITSEGGKSPDRCRHCIVDETGRYRRLFPIEMERLNMFPDNHTKDEAVSNSKRAFLMGNALVCGVVTKVGKEIEKRLKHC